MPLVFLKYLLKKDTRSCRKHLDSERNLKEDLFRLIKITKESLKINEIVELLNST